MWEGWRCLLPPQQDAPGMVSWRGRFMGQSRSSASTSDASYSTVVPSSRSMAVNLPLEVPYSVASVPAHPQRCPYLLHGLNGSEVLGPPVQHALIGLLLLHLLRSTFLLLLLLFLLLLIFRLQEQDGEKEKERYGIKVKEPFSPGHSDARGTGPFRSPWELSVL